MFDLVDRRDDFTLAWQRYNGDLFRVIGFRAAAKQKLQPIDTIFEAAFLDDLWQQDKWGYDVELPALENHQALLQCHQYLEMLD